MTKQASRRVRSLVREKLSRDRLASLDREILGCGRPIWDLFVEYGRPAGVAKTAFYRYAANIVAGRVPEQSLLPEILDALSKLVAMIAEQTRQASKGGKRPRGVNKRNRK